MLIKNGSYRLFRLAVWAVTAIALPLITSSVHAAPLYCTGTISAVLMYADGRVMIQGTWRGDFTDICNGQGTWGGIAETTCLSWYGAALKARKDVTTVTVYYPNGGSYTCATIPTYSSAPVPGYLMLQQ